MLRTVVLSLILFSYHLNSIAQSNNEWPENINSLINSTCVVKFYQPQSENLGIKDRARIKKNLSGILISKDGLIVTSDEIYPANLDISSGRFSFHRSQQLPEDITIIFKDEQKYKAAFLGKDEETKLAFLKIENPDNLPDFIRFTSNTLYNIGQPVFLIERLDKKYDFEPIVTKSNINSILTKPRKRLLINSSLKSLSNGGLVIDSKGFAIGIIQGNRRNYMYDPETTTSQHTLVEVLLASEFGKSISEPPTMAAIKKGGGKSWLGIQMQILKKEMAEYWKLGDVSGLIINKIVPNSPAEIAGINVGDIITSIGDFKIIGDDDRNLTIFRNHIRTLPESPVTLEFIRNSKSQTTQVLLRSAPKSQFLAEELPIEELGFSVKELTQDIFLNYNIDFDTEGVWVSRVEGAGIASIAGLYVGDLILEVNNYKVSDLKDFKNNIKDILENHPKYIQLFVLRGNKTLFIFLKNRIDELN
ncbi:PDZ domain-containing protein [Calditrichota bacterium]